MIMKEKQMQISQTYRADAAPSERKSALRGMLQRLGSTLLMCTLVMAATGSARAANTQDQAAVRALGDGFAKAFVQKNADLRASQFAEDGTFVTPQGDLLQGRAAMVKDFGTEAQAVNTSTQAAFSNYGSASSNPMSRSPMRSLPCIMSTVRMGRSFPRYRSIFSSWPSIRAITG